jgi:hypothetical protein
MATITEKKVLTPTFKGYSHGAAKFTGTASVTFDDGDVITRSFTFAIPASDFDDLTATQKKALIVAQFKVQVDGEADRAANDRSVLDAQVEKIALPVEIVSA